MAGVVLFLLLGNPKRNAFKKDAQTMLVKLTNTSDALRIMYDIHHQERQIRPGKSLEIDLDPKFVSRLQRAETSGDTLLVADLDDADQAEVDASTAKGGRYTHADGGGLERVRPKGVYDAQTIREAMGHGGKPQRAHGHDTSTDPAADKEGGPGLDDGNVDPNEDEIHKTMRLQAEAKTSRDRIGSNAKNAANKANKQPEPEKTEPKTAADLLAVHETIAPEELLRLAVNILPKDSLPRMPRPSQVIEGLTRQAKQDVKDAARAGKEAAIIARNTKASDGATMKAGLTITPPKSDTKAKSKGK